MTENNISLTGNIVTRAKLAAFLGKQYGTDRNIYEALGYPTDITYDDYAVRYARQDIASAVIDIPVDYTWSGGFSIIETDDDEETLFEKEWADLARLHGIVSKFNRLDKLTGVGRYGVLLIGMDDVTSREDWIKPVNPGRRRITYLKPLGENSAIIDKYVEDTTDPRCGFPELYSINIRRDGNNSPLEVKVHHTRVLHLADDLLESEIIGIPRLQAIWNRLIDLEKLMGGSAEMFWRGARPGYQGKLDPEYTLTSAARTALEDQLKEYEHNLRRFLINEGMSISSLDTQVEDPEKHVNIQIQAISAKTRIPKRLLTGSERGELASLQDRDNWFDYIGSRRSTYAELCIIRPFIEKCIKNNVLSAPKKDFSVNWVPLYEQSDKDRAEVGKIRVTALKEYSMNPQAEMIVPPLAFYRFFLGLSEDEIEMIEEIQKAAMEDEIDDSKDESIE